MESHDFHGLLCSLIHTKEDVRDIVDKIGLTSAHINFDGTTSNVVNDVVRKIGNDEQKLYSLVSAVGLRYGDRASDLSEACKSHLQHLARNNAASPSRKECVIKAKMNFDDFDERQAKFLRHALAEFLEINVADIEIVTVESGSVKIKVSLPAESAERLLERRNEPALAELLAALNFTELYSPAIEQTGLKPESSAYSIGMDGSWTLDLMNSFSRVYQQVYSFLYAIQVNHDDKHRSVVDYVFSTYPWRGGFSAVNFYYTIQKSVPRSLKPRIISIQFSSPGTLKLGLVAEVAKSISDIVDAMSSSENSASRAYLLAYRFLKSKDLMGKHVVPNVDKIVLTEADLEETDTHLRDLADAMNFPDLERFEYLTGNRVASLKILLSFYRRLQSLIEIQSNNLIDY